MKINKVKTVSKSKRRPYHFKVKSAFNERVIQAIGSHISTIGYESQNLTQLRSKLKDLVNDDKLWKALGEFVRVSKTIRENSDISLDW